MLKQLTFGIKVEDHCTKGQLSWFLNLSGVCSTWGGRACTDLHQVVVGPVQVFVQLDHQALKERRELLLLLPWL